MRLVLIGAGNLATQLGLALLRSGHEVAQVYSRTETSARALAEQLCCAWTDDLQAVTDADLYLLAVKDGVLAQVAAQLVRRHAGALFVHTAGSMPLQVLADAGAARCGVFYPMQTFSRTRMVDFTHIPVFIEASSPADEQLIAALAASVSQRVSTLSSADRRYLHLGAVLVCNFTNHCYARAARLLRQHGLPFDVMLPLVDETAAKIHQLSPEQAQTGPAVRYDRNVIDKHLELLAADASLAELYRLMSEDIHRLAQDVQTSAVTNKK